MKRAFMSSSTTASKCAEAFRQTKTTGDYNRAMALMARLPREQVVSLIDEAINAKLRIGGGR